MRSFAVEFSIIFLQKKDKSSLKWVEMLRHCSYVVRSIIWKVFNGLTLTWMVWIWGEGTAVLEEVFWNEGIVTVSF